MMSEWQAIETAPRDGVLVLLWQEDQGFGVGYYSEYTEEWWEAVDDETQKLQQETEVHLTSFSEGLLYSPTHWMPLPEPPEDM